MNHKELFSENRLKEYKNEQEHFNNFFFSQSLTAKLGIIEIVTRNRVYEILNKKNKLHFLKNSDETKIEDYDIFVSKQTLGFWTKIIRNANIQNDILNLNNFDFRKYAEANSRCRLRKYEKVSVCYDLLKTIRNRAFHFENLYKTRNIKKNELIIKAPRIITKIGNEIIGIMPNQIENFLDDILDCFDKELKNEIRKVGGNYKGPPLT